MLIMISWIRYLCLALLAIIAASPTQALSQPCPTLLSMVNIEVPHVLLTSLCGFNGSTELVITCNDNTWSEGVEGFCKSSDLNTAHSRMSIELTSSVLTLQLVQDGTPLDVARVVLLKEHRLNKYTISVWGQHKTRFVLSVHRACSIDASTSNTIPKLKGPADEQSSADKLGGFRATDQDFSNVPTTGYLNTLPLGQNITQLAQYGTKKTFLSDFVNHFTKQTEATPVPISSFMTRLGQSSNTIKPTKNPKTIDNVSGKYTTKNANSEKAMIQWMEQKRIEFENKMKSYRYEDSEIQTDHKATNPLPSSANTFTHLEESQGAQDTPQPAQAAMPQKRQGSSNLSIVDLLDPNVDPFKETPVSTTGNNTDDQTNVSITPGDLSDSVTTETMVTEPTTSTSGSNNEIDSFDSNVSPTTGSTDSAATFLTTEANEELEFKTDPVTPSSSQRSTLRSTIEPVTVASKDTGRTGQSITAVVDKLMSSSPTPSKVSVPVSSTPPGVISVTESPITPSAVLVSDLPSQSMSTTTVSKTPSIPAVLPGFQPSTVSIIETTSTVPTPALTSQPAGSTTTLNNNVVTKPSSSVIDTTSDSPQQTDSSVNKFSDFEKTTAPMYSSSSLMSRSISSGELLSTTNTPVSIKTEIIDTITQTSVVTIAPTSTKTVSFEPETSLTVSPPPPSPSLSSTAAIDATLTTSPTPTQSVQTTSSKEATVVPTKSTTTVTTQNVTLNKDGTTEKSGGADLGNDTFWPVVAALVVGIPSVIVLGIAIVIFHRRRRPNIQKIFNMKAMRKATSQQQLQQQQQQHSMYYNDGGESPQQQTSSSDTDDTPRSSMSATTRSSNVDLDV